MATKTRTRTTTVTMGQRLQTLADELLPDEYRTALHIAEQAQTLADQPVTIPEIPADLHPLTRGTITAEWLDKALAVEPARERARQRRGILLGLVRDARATAAAHRDSITDPLLHAYDTELHRLLDEVRDLADTLDGITTPAAAITNDLGPQWKHLVALSDDYQTLRTAQLVLMPRETQLAAAPNGGGEPHATDLFLANLDDLWPAWRTPELDADRYISFEGPAHRPEPWPADDVPLLLWLATSAARPWIPTGDQLAALHQSRAAAANPNPTTPPQEIRRLNGGAVTEYMNRPITPITAVRDEEV